MPVLCSSCSIVRQACGGPGPDGRSDSGALFQQARRNSGSADVRGAAAAGVGHRQCRRIPHDGRGPRRTRAGSVAGRGLCHDGPGCADQRPAAGILAVRDIDAAALSRYRPHQGAAARDQCVPTCSVRCRSISARPTSTTSTCSAAHSGSRRRRMPRIAATRGRA